MCLAESCGNPERECWLEDVSVHGEFAFPSTNHRRVKTDTNLDSFKLIVSLEFPKAWNNFPSKDRSSLFGRRIIFSNKTFYIKQTESDVVCVEVRAWPKPHLVSSHLLSPQEAPKVTAWGHKDLAKNSWKITKTDRVS